MANLLHRETKKYLRSVDTLAYVPGWRKGEPIPEGSLYIINPDLSAVEGYDPKYWIITGDTVSLMSQAERDAVDASEAQAAAEAEQQVLADRMQNDPLVVAMIKREADLSAKTVEEVRAELITALQGS